MQPILKVISRKFLVTVGALVALFQSGDTSFRLWIIAGVATIYVITEGVLDARGMPRLAHEVGEAIKEGIDQGEALTSSPDDLTPAPAGTPLPRAKPTLLAPLPEDLRS